MLKSNRYVPIYLTEDQGFQPSSPPLWHRHEWQWVEEVEEGVVNHDGPREERHGGVQRGRRVQGCRAPPAHEVVRNQVDWGCERFNVSSWCPQIFPPEWKGRGALIKTLNRVPPWGTNGDVDGRH